MIKWTTERKSLSHSLASRDFVCHISPVTAGFTAESLRAIAPNPPVKGCEVIWGKKQESLFA